MVEHLPSGMTDAPVNRLFVTPEIKHLLSVDDPSNWFPYPQSLKVVGRYVRGHVIGISLQGTSRADVVLERLKDVDEVWIMCIREPRPGWRIFGRFLQRGVYVGLAAHDAYHMKPKRASYAQAARAMERDWDATFGTIPILRSKNPDDYLVGRYFDVDQPQA